MGIGPGLAPTQVPDQPVNLLAVNPAVVPVGHLHTVTGLKAAPTAHFDLARQTALAALAERLAQATERSQIEPCQAVVQLFHVPARWRGVSSATGRGNLIGPSPVTVKPSGEPGDFIQKAADLNRKMASAGNAIYREAIEYHIRKLADGVVIDLGVRKTLLHVGDTATAGGQGHRLGIVQGGKHIFHFGIKGPIKH